jgi:hypothetical protein
LLFSGEKIIGDRMHFAAQTNVDSDRSKMEIEKTLRRYGADSFVSGWGEGQVIIGFQMKDRKVRFNLPMPERDHYKATEGGRKRWSDSAVEEAWQQGIRQRWRALALVVKAKLEAVESGITTFEEEFLAHIVLPGGRTVWENTRSSIKIAYESGKVPGLLLGFHKEEEGK